MYVATFILFIIVVFLIAFSAYTPHRIGTVTITQTYSGVGQIGGFASGTTGEVTYEVLTIYFPSYHYLLFNNPPTTINFTVSCNYYKAGSQIAFYANLNAPASLAKGC